MKQDDLMLWQVADRVGHITFNRPDAGNAVNLPLARAFAAVVGQAAQAVAAGAVGALFMTARGRQYCVGGDIQSFIARRDDLSALVDEILTVVHPAIHILATLPVSLVTAVQGPIGGAGIAMALCGDFVLAADSIKLRGGYTAIGLSPDAGASWFVTRRAGPSVAKRIFMRNESIPAEECLRLGLVDELHPADALPSAALQLARTLANGAAGSLAAVKRLCDGAAAHDLHAHLDLEHRLLRERTQSPDSREGIAAFVEKRTPVFSSSLERTLK